MQIKLTFLPLPVKRREQMLFYAEIVSLNLLDISLIIGSGFSLSLVSRTQKLFGISVSIRGKIMHPFREFWLFKKYSSHHLYSIQSSPNYQRAERIPAIPTPPPLEPHPCTNLCAGPLVKIIMKYFRQYSLLLIFYIFLSRLFIHMSNKPKYIKGVQL